MEHSPPPPPPEPPYYEEASEPFLPRDTTTEPHVKGRTRAKTQTKALFALGGIAVIFMILLCLPENISRHTHHAHPSNATLDPFTVAGTENWTLPLPLSPLTPGAMALTCMAIQHRAGHTHKHADYYAVDQSFVDPTGEEKVLTYSLAAASVVGLAESLLEVFTAYGLARQEGRRFVIDDAGWEWGAWDDYFLSSSDTDAGEGSLPCPRSVRRLSVAHSTRGWIFGHAFTEHFESPRERGSRRQKRVFSLARTGYEALLRVRPALAARVGKRVEALKAEAGDGGWVGIQVRRGDYKPRTWQWLKGTGVQLDAVADVAAALSDGRGRVVVMSDDRDVVTAPELAGSLAAVEGGAGLLEGGYTRGGLLKLGGRERREVAERWLEEILVMRELVGAGTIDEGGVVCGGASATCRLLAVMLGWDMGVINERWRDVDGGIGWSGVDW